MSADYAEAARTTLNEAGIEPDKIVAKLRVALDKALQKHRDR